MATGRQEWCIVEDGLDPLKTGHRETVCALGNGYLGVRGAPEEGHPASNPATFIAGVFDAAPGGVPELVVAPNWLCMRVFIDGEECGMASGELLGFRRTLDMRDGVLERVVRWRGSRGRTVRLTWRRLVSMADARAAAVSLSIEPEDGDVEVVVDSVIDGRVSNAKAVHLDVVGRGWDEDASYLVARTRSSGVVIAEAQVVAAFGGEVEVLRDEPHCPGVPVAMEATRVCQDSYRGGPVPAVGDDGSQQAGAPHRVSTSGGGAAASDGGTLPARAAVPPAGATRSEAEASTKVSFRLRCRRGERVAVEKYVGFGTSLDLEGGRGRGTAPAGCAENADDGAAGGPGEAGTRGDAAAVLGLALDAARRGAARRFAGLLEEHRKAWHDIWDRCDIVIEGDDFAQKAVRFAIFQMVQAAPRHTDRVSIGARGLSGEGYKGHVFWDTETFVVPFFTFTLPDVARNLLSYRYNTLPAARRNAASKGYRGAMFAWESADTGEETTPPWGDPDPETGERRRILCGDLEHHITADVAYAVWQYCMATADEEFLLQKGAEILIETGRFWASRASYNPVLQMYEILHVIGPDEYHEDVNNNFYTNAMARWNIRAALAASDYLRACHPSEWTRLVSATGISQDELAHMAEVADRLVRGRVLSEPLGRTGAQVWPCGEMVAGGRAQSPLEARVIEQFDGFGDLADVEIQVDEAAFKPMEAVIGPGALARSKVVKQPDVLMALYLLEDGVTGDVDRAVEEGSGSRRPPRGWGGQPGEPGDAWRPGPGHPVGAAWRDVLLANWEYYEPRTDHGSSLSCAIHSTIASRLGLDEEAWRYFMRAARIDLADAMGNTANGVHMATQGGLWQAVVNGFAGIRAAVSVPRERDAREYGSGSVPSLRDAASLAPWAGGALTVDPRLPGRWKHLSVPLTWRGTRVRVEFEGSRR
ncbi:MAG: glycoside hydrolase family 65 protein [Clostridia bacterium]